MAIGWTTPIGTSADAHHTAWALIPDRDDPKGGDADRTSFGLTAAFTVTVTFVAHAGVSSVRWSRRIPWLLRRHPLLAHSVRHRCSRRRRAAASAPPFGGEHGLNSPLAAGAD